MRGIFNNNEEEDFKRGYASHNFTPWTMGLKINTVITAVRAMCNRKRKGNAKEKNLKVSNSIRDRNNSRNKNKGKR